MNDILLTIIVPVYNHEKYIERALDSILMQKTSFSFEILVGEDCSTDKSRQILREYEKKHPGVLSVFYRTHNLYDNPINNHIDLYNHSKGKYIITLEGDDFWIKESKLEEQIAFLEQNPQYIAVAHNCIVVGDDGNKLKETYPYCTDDEYTINHYLADVYPGQTASLMYRNIWKMNNINKSILFQNLQPGDKILNFVLISNGQIKCLQEHMSAYRHITNEGYSYSATHKYSFEYDEKYYFLLYNYAKQNSPYPEYIGAIYIRTLIYGILKRQLCINELQRKMKNIDNILLSLKLLLQRFWSIHITKKGREGSVLQKYHRIKKSLSRNNKIAKNHYCNSDNSTLNDCL